jgi:hypothetical protein
MNDSDKDKELEDLRKSIELKEGQISTLNNTLKMKDDLIKTLQDSLDLKENQIKSKDQTIEGLQQQIEESSGSTLDAAALEERDKKIAELEEEITVLNEELAAADEDIENLTEQLESGPSSAPASASSFHPFSDFTTISIKREALINKIKEILSKALHSVTISVPSIIDLQDLDLYEVKSSVNMKISCLIDPSLDEHIDLLEEFESLDNLNVRTYESGDRWVILRDGEELFFAACGTKEDNFLTFYTKDSDHIKLFNSLVMEAWLRSRKI